MVGNSLPCLGTERNSTGTGSCVLPTAKAGIYGNDAAEARWYPWGVDVNGKILDPASTITTLTFPQAQLPASECVGR